MIDDNKNCLHADADDLKKLDELTCEINKIDNDDENNISYLSAPVDKQNGLFLKLYELNFFEYNKLIKFSEKTKKKYVVYEFYNKSLQGYKGAQFLKIYVASWNVLKLAENSYCIGIDAIEYNKGLITFLDGLSLSHPENIKILI